MTLEEKLKAKIKTKSRIIYGVTLGEPFFKKEHKVIEIEDAITICKEEIESACKKQEFRFQIYAKAINQIDDFFEYRYRNYSGEQTKQFVMDVIDGIIKKLNAPSSKD